MSEVVGRDQEKEALTHELQAVAGPQVQSGRRGGTAE
jgi:hypothetical protein